MRTSYPAALVVPHCDSHLVKSGWQLCRIGEHDVVPVGFRFYEAWRRAHDPVHEARRGDPFVVEIDGSEIQDGLCFPVRLLTKHKKLTRHLYRSRKHRSFARHVVIIDTDQYRKTSLRIGSDNRLTQPGRSGFSWRWRCGAFGDNGLRIRIEIEVTLAHSHRKIRPSDQLDLDVSESAALL